MEWLLSKLRPDYQRAHAEAEDALKCHNNAIRKSYKDLTISQGRINEAILAAEDVNDRVGALMQNTMARMKELDGKEVPALHRVGGMEHLKHEKDSDGRPE